MTRISTPDAQAANDAFATAQALLMPAAYAETPPGAALTAGQAVFAQAMAWQGALLARLETLGEELPEPSAMRDVPPNERRGECSMSVFNEGPEIQYPSEALFRCGVGAVVAHFSLDADGTVRARTVAASVPPGPLAEAVDRTLANWRVAKQLSFAPNCRIPPSLYFTVRFILR